MAEIQGLGSLGAHFKALWVLISKLFGWNIKQGIIFLKNKTCFGRPGSFLSFSRGKKPGNEVSCIHGYDRNTISLDNAISGVISAIKACGDAQKLSLLNQGFG